MPWSNKPPKWALQLPRTRVPQVSRLRPGWDLLIAATFLVGLSLSFRCSAQSPSTSPASPPPPQTPTPPPAPRFVVVLDAAHGGDDTGAHLDSGQFENPPTSRSTSASAPCLPPAESRSSPRANLMHPSTSTGAQNLPTTPTPPSVSACTPAKTALAFISSHRRLPPRSPHASRRGRPPNPHGSPAAWLSPEQSTPR